MAIRTLVFLIAALAGWQMACTEKKAPSTYKPSAEQSGAKDVGEASASDTTLAGKYFSNGEKFAEAANYDSAIVYFEKASALYEANEIWEKQALCYNKMGENSWRKRALDQAVRYLDKALEIGLHHLGEKHREIANNYYHKGTVYFLKGEYDEAITWLNQALNLCLSIFGEQHPDVARSYNVIGLTYQNQGDYDRALEFCDKAVSIQLATLGEQHPDVAQSYTSLGEINWHKGNYDHTLDLYNKALTIRLATLGELHPDVGKSYNNLGIVHAEKGDYEQALDVLDKALSIKLKTLRDQHPQVASSYLNMGNLYYYKGDFDQALVFFNKATSILKALLGEQHPAVAHGFNNLGGVYDALGNFDQAIEFYGRAASIWRTALGEQHPDVARSYNNLGRTFAHKGDFREALIFHDKALQILRATLGERHPYVAESYYNKGVAYTQKGHYDQALIFHDKALTIRLANFGEYHPLMAASYNDLAKVHIYKANYGRAIEYCQQALRANVPDFAAWSSYANPMLKNMLSEIELLRSLELKAGALASRYTWLHTDLQDLEDAASTYQYASLLIDQIRSSYKAEGSKLLFADQATAIYEKAVQTILKLYEVTHNSLHKETAFTFAEKTKAGILLEAFSDTEAQKIANLPDSLLKQERQLRIDLAFYDKNLSEEKLKNKASDSAKIALWQDKVFTLKQKYDALLQKFEKEYPDYYNLKYQVNTASVREVQEQILDENTALVEYFNGEDSIFIFNITQNDFDVTSTAKDSLFGQQIKQLRDGIIKKDYSLYAKAAHLLYQTLLGPIKNKLAARNLIIVPDGPLSAIPFEALLTEQVARSNLQDYAKLPYLVNDHAISYAYSATLLLETLKRRRTQSNRDYLAYAPVFPAGLPAASRGADFVNQNLAVDSVRTAGRVFGYLSASKQEVTGVLEQFKARQNFFARWFDNKARVYLEHEAKEANLKSTALRDYRYVHFATHGLLNEKNPKLSGLVMAQDTTSSEDGILYLGEIYNLDLNADLVTLSACETGLGQLAKGEGIIGLTRGFLYAGASNLLVSLWQVNDQTTADLMVDFYGNMLNGQSKAEALRQAKLKLIQSHPEYGKPYYWAPFILIGK